MLTHKPYAIRSEVRDDRKFVTYHPGAPFECTHTKSMRYEHIELPAKQEIDREREIHSRRNTVDVIFRKKIVHCESENSECVS